MPIGKYENTHEKAEAFESSSAAFDDIGIPVDLNLDDKEDLDVELKDDLEDDLSVGRILKMAEEGLLLLDTASDGEALPVDGVNDEDDLYSIGTNSDDDDDNDDFDGADDGNANVDTTGTDSVEYGNDNGEGEGSDAFHVNAGMAATKPSVDGASLSSISPSACPDRRFFGNSDGPPPPLDQVRVDVAVRSGVASARRASGEDMHVQQRHVSPPTPTMGNLSPSHSPNLNHHLLGPDLPLQPPPSDGRTDTVPQGSPPMLGLVSGRAFARPGGSSLEVVPAAARGADLLPTPPLQMMLAMTIMTTMNWMRREA